MKIQILGTGCPKCRQLAENARQALEQAGVAGEVVKVQNLEEIMSFGVMMTPSLAIDGEVKTTGKLLSVEEIRQLLRPQEA